MKNLIVVFAIIEIAYGIDRFIDLTWPFDGETIYWPDNQPFMFTKKIAETRNSEWYAANEFTTAEHGGTHFDAPYHFNSAGYKVGDIPLSTLIVSGVMINLTKEVESLKSRALLLPSHLESWEHRHGCIPNNSVLLVYFGWSKYYHNKELYLGIDEQNNLNSPGISEEAAQWIVDSNKIVGVGVDTASVDAGKETVVHKILSNKQIYNLENVHIPPEFPENNFTLYVMPMKIKEGSGAPVRIIATPRILLRKDGSTTNNANALGVPWYGHVIIILSSFILLILYVITIAEHK